MKPTMTVAEGKDHGDAKRTRTIALTEAQVAE